MSIVEVVAPKLILATGVVDQLPSLEGLDAIWGRSAWRCPICDGWEHRDHPLAVGDRNEKQIAEDRAADARYR